MTPPDPYAQNAAGRPAALIQLLQVVAVAANEAATVEDALQTCLDAVCAHTGWPLGHAFLTDSTGALAATGCWHADGADRFPRFRAATEAARFAPGEGIAGRVLATGEAMWVEDVAAYFTKALSTPAAANKTFELGGPDVVTFAELNERIRRALDKKRLAFQMPTGLLKAGAAVGSLLPPLRGARDGVAMLEFEDNVTDIGPAVEALGVKPVGLDEMLRRATAST